MNQHINEYPKQNTFLFVLRNDSSDLFYVIEKDPTSALHKFLSYNFIDISTNIVSIDIVAKDQFNVSNRNWLFI